MEQQSLTFTDREIWQEGSHDCSLQVIQVFQCAGEHAATAAAALATASTQPFICTPEVFQMASFQVCLILHIRAVKAKGGV